MTNTSEEKICQNCKQPFVVEPDDFLFYKKINVPPPTFCWKCRFQRRLAWRNERTLFRGKSAKSGKEILTIVPPNSKISVFDESEWWSDSWNPLEYGKEYDFSKPFFEQFASLLRSVPFMSRNVTQMVNSDYSANSGFLKNCYLLFNATSDEDCAYGVGVNSSRFCFDNCNIEKCERCYQSFWITSCYQTHFSIQCTDCVKVMFSKSCRGCSNCIGCVNLTNKQYCIFNIQYSKGEYERRVSSFRLDTWTRLLKMEEEAHRMWLSFPNRYIQGTHNINVTGAYVTDSKNVKCGYFIRESKDCKYCQYLQDPHNEDAHDITIWGGNIQLSYENALCGYGTARTKFCINCYDEIHDLEYCAFSGSSSDLFGCVGLRNKQYCILNKQYDKETYHNLKKKIINHMNILPYTDKRGRVYKYGEFFPIELSPYGYNNTIAMEHFPMTKDALLQEGYGWIENDTHSFSATLKANDLTDSIKDAEDKILDEFITCSECESVFRVIKSELVFLREEGIPLPRSCAECRHKKRILNREKAFLFAHKCGCTGTVSRNGEYKNNINHFHGNNPCPNEFETSYSPDRPEIVYCEQCYQSEIV